MAGLPTLPSEPAAVGPLSGEQLAATTGVDSASCQPLGDLLAQIPQAQNWTQLLKVQTPEPHQAALPLTALLLKFYAWVQLCGSIKLLG